MARLNTTTARNTEVTHGGVPAPAISDYQRLRRSVLACMLWENGFYEDGKSIAERIQECAERVSVDQLSALAVEARSQHNLRHVPLLLLSVLAKRAKGKTVSETIAKVLQRADEMAEFLAVYWRNGKTPISKQVKVGLAKAFQKFDAYQLAKYNRDGAIKLRDVLFLCHAKPKDDKQAETWKALVGGTLPAPDTWEVALSAGQDQKAVWERLISEGKLGYLALLRNLRNMTEAGVDRNLIGQAILARKGAERVLPFRYVAAARACPTLEAYLDQALSESIAGMPALSGNTVVLVDVSGSMDDRLSSKSDLRRIDAAAALASIIHGNLRVFTFSQTLVEVPPRRGMAGVDTIIQSQPHSGTALGGAVDFINKNVSCDRLIVITDEQATDCTAPGPAARRGYMINVAAYNSGVGYGAWVHIDGFSESVLRWMTEYERDAG